MLLTKGKERRGGGIREAWRSELPDEMVWGGNIGQAHDCPGGPRSASPEVRGGRPPLRCCLDTGNRPGGPRPPAPRSRRGGQERRWETGGAGESELRTPPAACKAPGSRGQHPDPSTLGRLCLELHPFRVNSLINPFRKAEATLSLREFEKNPYAVGKGCKVSLHWPPSCTSRCLELHP